jgi:hypothetical protein
MARDVDLIREKLTRKAMTVGELIERLGDFDAALPVGFACDYGDHCHTEQFLPVEMVEANDETDYGPKYLTESAYSHSGLALDHADDDYEGDEERDTAEDDGGSFGCGYNQAAARAATLPCVILS